MLAWRVMRQVLAHWTGGSFWRGWRPHGRFYRLPVCPRRIRRRSILHVAVMRSHIQEFQCLHIYMPGGGRSSLFRR